MLSLCQFFLFTVAFLSIPLCIAECPGPKTVNYIPVTVGPAIALLLLGILVLILIKLYLMYRVSTEFGVTFSFAEGVEIVHSQSALLYSRVVHIFSQAVAHSPELVDLIVTK